MKEQIDKQRQTILKGLFCPNIFTTFALSLKIYANLPKNEELDSPGPGWAADFFLRPQTLKASNFAAL